jgi:hypothetical protein
MAKRFLIRGKRMLRWAWCVGVFASVAFAADAANEANPIIGSWEWIVEETDCKETYTYALDGTMTTISAAERTVHTFEIEALPGKERAYEVRMQVVNDNGLKDCAGAQDDVTGQKYTRYMFFDENYQSYTTCLSEVQEECLGPLHRVTVVR